MPAMRLAIPLLAASFLIGALELARRAPVAPLQEHGATSAAEIFRGRCVQCHVPPDPAFEVDRAWLNQVRETA